MARDLHQQNGQLLVAPSGPHPRGVGVRCAFPWCRRRLPAPTVAWRRRSGTTVAFGEVLVKEEGGQASTWAEGLAGGVTRHHHADDTVTDLSDT